MVDTPYLLLLALRGAALHSLLALRLAVDPLSVNRLATLTGFSSYTVGRALKTLALLGLANRPTPRGGWQIQASAKLDGLVDSLFKRSSLPPERSPALEVISEPEYVPAAGVQAASSTDGENKPAKTIDRESLNKTDLNRINQTKDSDSQSESHSPVETEQSNEFNPDFERLRKAVADLFGEPVYLPYGWKTDAKLFIQIVAEAWAQRDRLRHPARAVHQNLKTGALPKLRYRKDPLNYLPEKFLIQAGLKQYRLPEGYSIPEESDPPETNQPVDPSLEHRVGTQGRFTVRQAWEAAVQNMDQGNLPEIASRTLKELEPVSFDRSEPSLTLLAPCESSRQWFINRLAPSMGRILNSNFDLSLRLHVICPT